MAVVAVPFILYLVRFCSSKSCKLQSGVEKNTLQLYEYEYGSARIALRIMPRTVRYTSYRASWDKYRAFFLHSRAFSAGSTHCDTPYLQG